MKKLLPFFALIFIGFLLFYFGLPVVNYGFIKLPLLLLVLVCLGMAFFTKLQFSNQAQNVKVLSKPNRLFFIVALILLLYMTVLPLLTSLPLFRSASYQKLIGKIIG